MGSLTRFPLDQQIILGIDTYSDAARTNPANPTTLELDLLAQSVTPPVETPYTWAGGGLVNTGTGLFTWTPTSLPSGNYAYHGKATGAVATGLDGRFKVLAKYAIDVTVADLALYLNDTITDTARAQLILDEAHELCETIVDPLPPKARSVVLDVAERAFANPTNVAGSDLGLYSEGVGPYSTGTPGTAGGGLYLTKGNKATLRRLNGSGGAFSIDMLPAELPTLPSWDVGSDASLLGLP